MAIFTLAGYAVVAILGSFYAVTPTSFLVAWIAHGVLSGCYFTSAASLGQRLFPHSKYAQFASAAGILGSLTGMVVVPLIGVLIDKSGNIYRYTFTVGFVLSLIALGAACFVHGKFLKLGGPKSYVAPE